MFKTKVLPTLLAGLWINLSEFLRNEFLLKAEWTEHYQSLGLEFPSQALNGIIWGLWAFIFATALGELYRSWGFSKTLVWGWVMGFVLMWLVCFNLLVLPLKILYAAIPLSVLEVALAVYIFQYFDSNKKHESS